MIKITRSRLLACLAVFSVFVIAACTPSYINTEELGERASAAEIKTHYSGKSLRFAQVEGGSVNAEIYFDPDGTYKFVDLNRPIVGLGTWEISESLGTAHLMTNVAFFDVEEKIRRNNGFESYSVYIQPDGSAMLDEMGGINYSQPAPVRGFPMEARFERLRKQGGL